MTKQLEKYQSVYGDSSTLPPDVQQLSEQLQRQEAEVLRLRLLDKQRGEVGVSSYMGCEMTYSFFWGFMTG